jgi:hypothetical protein
MKMGQSETLSSTSQIIFITLFSAGGQQLLRLVPATTTEKSCWLKTVFLIQTGIRWIFFIQFYSSGSHTEHCWRCSLRWIFRDYLGDHIKFI